MFYRRSRTRTFPRSNRDRRAPATPDRLTQQRRLRAVATRPSHPADNTNDFGNSPRKRDSSAGQSRVRSWWRVLGSNQRRLSRRFYRPLPLTTRATRLGTCKVIRKTQCSDRIAEATVVADSSFDVVSKVDRQEVDNALNQAAKEVGQRFDFKGTGASITWSGESGVEIKANSDDRVRAVLDVFKERLIKRSVSLKALDHGDPQPAAGGTSHLVVTIKQGIDDEKARAIVKRIKSDGPKGVQSQIQGDAVRVSAKKKDDLQAVISLLREADFGIPLQFQNYR
jgi:uncharacterized protein YajQ (UPF0234 family)